MDQPGRFQETLRRLTLIDDGFVEVQARLELDLAGTAAPDPKTDALVQVAVRNGIGGRGPLALRRIGYSRASMATASRSRLR